MQLGVFRKVPERSGIEHVHSVFAVAFDTPHMLLRRPHARDGIPATVPGAGLVNPATLPGVVVDTSHTGGVDGVRVHPFRLSSPVLR